MCHSAIAECALTLLSVGCSKRILIASDVVVVVGGFYGFLWLILLLAPLTCGEGDTL